MYWYAQLAVFWYSSVRDHCLACLLVVACAVGACVLHIPHITRHRQRGNHRERHPRVEHYWDAGVHGISLDRSVAGGRHGGVAGTAKVRTVGSHVRKGWGYKGRGKGCSTIRSLAFMASALTEASQMGGTKVLLGQQKVSQMHFTYLQGSGV